MLLSMTASAAWPLMSYAKRAGPDLEICSVHAKKAGGDGTGSLPAGDDSRDCAMCCMASQKLLAQSSATGVFLLSALQLEADYAPSADLVVPGDLLRYPPAQPRAPPTLL